MFVESGGFVFVYILTSAARGNTSACTRNFFFGSGGARWGLADRASR